MLAGLVAIEKLRGVTLFLFTTVSMEGALAWVLKGLGMKFRADTGHMTLTGDLIPPSVIQEQLNCTPHRDR